MNNSSRGFCSAVLCLFVASTITQRSYADDKDIVSESSSTVKDKSLARNSSSVRKSKRVEEIPAVEVEMFAALDSGDLQIDYLPQDATKAVLIFRNATNKPMKIKLAETFGAMPVLAQDAASTSESNDALIPHYLLGLVHAPEVHVELELTQDQVNSLESLFYKIDAKWFPARILPADKQLTVIQKLEQDVIDWFKANTSRSQQERLQQLEYYAQGSRSLLREDVGKRIGLHPTQQSKLAVFAKATDDAQQKLSRSQFGDTEIKTLQSTLAESAREERAAVSKIIRPEQRQKLTALLGPTFDPSKLKRIYAMAPEFVKVKTWINSNPLTASDLRGKVVLVHFYAFQCHNCHANFAIYQRWHKELTDKGVVVIGIQTPETSAERNPEAIKVAAIERKLDFPIVVDLESENWKAWGNTLWPTVYVVDKNGYIRHWWQGEMNWKGATADKTIEAVVDDLLAERSKNEIVTSKP